MNITTIALSNIDPAEYNPRTITKDEFDGLKKSLQTFGQQENLIVNKDMTLISGHQRMNAMLALGWTEAVCNVVDLDKHQEKKLNVIMNSQAIAGSFDELKLSEILEELKLDDDYEALRLNVLEPLDLSPTEVEEDEPPEVSSEPPDSKLGEIYQLGRHRVMCGDSTDKASVELLMNGEKADMVYTDPPYGMSLDVDYDSMFKNDKNHKAKGDRFEAVIDDDKYFDPTSILKMVADVKEVFLWGADYFYDSLPRGGSLSAWDKRTENLDKVVGNTTEFLWSKQPHRRMTARVLWSGHHGMGSSDEKSRVHPTQKPLKLHEWFFDNYGNKSKRVLDLFLGSGSTLIACEQTDRTCYGMELDPRYVDVIRKRYAKFIGEEDNWQQITPRVDNA